MERFNSTQKISVDYFCGDKNMIPLDLLPDSIFFPNTNNFYNPALRKRVSHIYNDDFETLGYDNEGLDSPQNHLANTSLPAQKIVKFCTYVPYLDLAQRALALKAKKVVIFGFVPALESVIKLLNSFGVEVKAITSSNIDREIYQYSFLDYIGINAEYLNHLDNIDYDYLIVLTINSQKEISELLKKYNIEN